MFGIAVWGGLAVLLVASSGLAEIGRIGDLVGGDQNLRRLAGEFVHPDFSAWRLYLVGMGQTLAMALWGTVLALIIAVPLGLAGARNLAPAWLRHPARRLLDLLRSVPDLVVGALFVAAVGLGPFAGVMALAINTGGVLGKLFSEAVEAIDPGPIEGVRATGASPAQAIIWGVLPQAAPLWTSYALYRFEFERPLRDGSELDWRRRHRPEPVRFDQQLRLRSNQRHRRRHLGRGERHRPALAAAAESADLTFGYLNNRRRRRVMRSTRRTTANAASLKRGPVRRIGASLENPTGSSGTPRKF